MFSEVNAVKMLVDSHRVGLVLDYGAWFDHMKWTLEVKKKTRPYRALPG